jgi:hypothetical protein
VIYHCFSLQLYEQSVLSAVLNDYILVCVSVLLVGFQSSNFLVDNRNWAKTNQALVKRGSVLLDLEFLKNWKGELNTLNSGKVGC